MRHDVRGGAREAFIATGIGSASRGVEAAVLRLAHPSGARAGAAVPGAALRLERGGMARALRLVVGAARFPVRRAERVLAPRARSLGRRAALLLLPLALAGCTLLYEPSKQPTQACPQSAAACAPRDNARAACADTACSYTCAEGFADLDGDLNAATGSGTGCEVRCTGAAPPAHPPQLTATAGINSGALVWDWPQSPGAAAYRLCRGPRCTRVSAGDVCAQGRCTTTTTGDADGVRVEGRLEALGRCDEAAPLEGAPRASQVPFAFLSASGWTTTSNCAPQLAVTGQSLAITQTLFCSSYLLVGDGLAADATLDVEVRFDAALAASALLGLVVRAGQSQRVVALTAPLGADDDLSTQLRRFPERVVARATPAPPFDAFWHLRLVARGEAVSLQLGPDASSLREALRWYDPAPTAGRLGLAVLSPGLTSVRAEFRGLTVSSAAVLPAPGAPFVRVDFADLPDAGVRLRSAAQLEFFPCPVAPGCDAGCAPAPGARCAKVGRSGFFNPAIAVDLPTGVDTRKPWSASLRFLLPADAGVNAGAILSGTFGPLLGTSAKAWDAGIEVLGQPTALSLSLSTWHRGEFSFDPVGKQVRFALDGANVPLAVDAFPPPTWDRFLGALQLGDWGFGTSSVTSTDLTLSQP